MQFKLVIFIETENLSAAELLLQNNLIKGLHAYKIVLFRFFNQW